MSVCEGMCVSKVPTEFVNLFDDVQLIPHVHRMTSDVTMAAASPPPWSATDIISAAIIQTNANAVCVISTVCYRLSVA